LTKLLLGLGTTFIGAAAFVAGVLVDRHLLVHGGVEAKPDGSAAKPKPNKTPIDMRREAFAQYLDGKTITLKNTQDPKDKGMAHTIRKDQIGAVQFPYAMSALAGEPFLAEVMLVLNTSEGRYLIRSMVPFHQFGEDFFFRGFEVKDVLKQ